MPESPQLIVLTRRRENASFRQRIAAYLPALAEAGLHATVVELAANPIARLAQLRGAAGAGCVWLHRKRLSLIEALALGRGAPVVYDLDDAVWLQARKAERGPHAGRLADLRRTVRRATVTLAGSPTIAEQVRQLAGRAEVVPTGLDTSRYTPKTDHGAGEGLRLVWIGSRSTLALLEPFRAMLERLGRDVPGVSLRVIADASLEVDGLAVENVSWSREAEARLLAECDAGIAPMPDTPYTRGKCGFKVLQYMAAGLPVLTSPVGVNADYVWPGETGLHAATADEWIVAARRLAADAELRRTMGAAGRQRAEREFDMRVLASKIVSPLQSVAGGA